MTLFRDEYILGQSMMKSLSSVGEAIRIDLSLNPNPHLMAGTVSGIIKDGFGKPITDAVVMILDESYGMLANTTSGNGGIFIISPLEPGNDYHAYAQAPGFKFAQASHFTLHPQETIELEFVLLPDPEAAKSIITGEIQNSLGFPIRSASIELYRVEETATKLINLSLSNEVGQFVLHDLEQGMYFLKVNALNYFSSFFPVEIRKASGIIRMDTILKENPKASNGIVTGIITDIEDQPLGNADVILYCEESDQSLIPISYTRTNHEGIYLFVNIPQGNYRVNANRSVTLE